MQRYGRDIHQEARVPRRSHSYWNKHPEKANDVERLRHHIQPIQTGIGAEEEIQQHIA